MIIDYFRLRFANHLEWGWSTLIFALALGDFDGDRAADLAIVTKCGPCTDNNADLEIRLGDRKAGFRSAFTDVSRSSISVSVSESTGRSDSAGGQHESME